MTWRICKLSFVASMPSLAIIMALASTAAGAATPSASVHKRFLDPATPMLVVAHRACHNPAPRHRMSMSLPENSISAIERCIALGVDMAEVDVRRTRDGYLVLMHDETVDRTTNGRGKVAELTLAEVRALRLRDNEGGPGTKTTEMIVPTLEEGLTAAKGRIMLNLDVQASLYVETVASVRATGQEDGVVVKQMAGTGSPILADLPPFDRVPFMPILVSGLDMTAIASRQASAKSRPIALELPRMAPDALPGLKLLSQRTGIRLWVNSLWEGFVEGFGGDLDALREPDAVWGRMRRSGISVIQTDEPEALLAYLNR